MRYHIIAFFLGFLLDLLLGDPYGFPHPVRLIGKLITGTEKMLRAGSKKKPRAGTVKRLHTGSRHKQNAEAGLAGAQAMDGRDAEFRQGIALVIIVLTGVAVAATFLLLAAYRIHPYAGMAVECLMTYQILAVKCLKVESMKVCQCLKNGRLEQARTAVSMIVGRNTECLDEEGVAKSAVETVAENTSDGVIAPMLYLAVGGPVLGFLYKAVNTMDSMVGYKNEEYMYFGRAAAKVDDFMNFFPARCSAFLMIAVSCFFDFGERYFTGRYFAGHSKKCFSGKGAVTIYQRDRRKHASPNSAQTESVCAGALGIQLAGDASYFGKIVQKPLIGDALRRVEHEDIRRANQLMYGTAWLCEMLCLLLLLVLG